MRSNKLISTLIINFICFVLAFTAIAETNLKFDGQVRLRSESTKKSFESDADFRQLNVLRTRLGIKAEKDENTSVYIQFQDSRTLGDKDQFDKYQSGTLFDGKNVDMHQAFIKVDQLWEGGPGFKAGRFEVNFGNQRIFGAVGWHNVGRSWEGMMAWLENANFRADGFWLKVHEDVNNHDFDIFGLYTDIPSANLELFTFYEFDSYKMAIAPSTLSAVNELDRINFGFRFDGSFDAFDVDLTGVYQTGKKANYTTNPISEYDIKAFMVAGEAGYTFSGNYQIRFVGGVDYSSGDDNSSDNEIKTYQNSYYTGHKFRGFMDYFIATSYEGLIDLFLKGSFVPVEGWKVKGDFHYFKSAEKRATFNSPSTSDFGMEFDLTISTTRIQGIKLDAGASVFLAEDNWVGADSDPGYWLYAMLTAGFKK